MTSARSAWAGATRSLLLTSMAIFVVTVVIGILNGLDLVEFPRDQLLTHVHAGTLGWIALGIVASAFWLFGAADRRLGIALAVLIPIYAAAFFSGNLTARAITGTAVLIAILWLLAWVWRSYLAGERSLPRLGVALGLTTFTYGAIIGVVLQIQFASGTTLLSGDAIGAHAGAMVFSFVVLSAMGLLEWRLRATADLPRGGVTQLAALFLGGLVLSVGLLVGAGQAAGGIYLLAELVAVALFARRILPTAIRVPWGTNGPERHIGAAAIWVIVGLLLFMYLIVLFIGAKGDVAAIPQGALIASDHSVFIGVMTNLLIGLVATFSADQAGRYRWANPLIFWGLNVGLAVFVVGLIAESAVIKRVGSPVMGLAILLALAVLAARTWSSRGPAEA